ncbi:putative N-acetyltransferase camello isoform X2 [Festucalex cinctus]
MAQKNNLQLTIREYRPSDHRVVMELFCDSVRENIYPAFFKSMSHPDHVGVALSISMAGYVLGGSSYFQALLFGTAWAGLIYFCCHEIYEGYMLRRISTDMADIQANYLEKPNNGFWVAETGDRELPRVVGMVAVMGRRETEEDGHRDNLNGGVGTSSSADGSGDSGEMTHLVVAFPWRRRKLGSQLTQRALDFCKERGLARLVLDVSSPQTGAVSLLRKAGFVQTLSHDNTHSNCWLSKLARISVMRMEKFL